MTDHPEPARGWFDSHCHLGHGDLPEEAREVRAASVVAAAQRVGVSQLVDVGIDAESSRLAAARAIRLPGVRFTAGLHPCSAHHLDRDWPQIEDLARRQDCAALGETGFDFHWQPDARAVQQRAFERHLALARELGRTVIVHSREAFDATFEVLAEHPGARSIIHCFSGGPREAERALELGCRLSFAGPLTWRNTTELQEAARLTPLDRILIETDAPFLTPAPHRGTINEPAYVRHVGHRLAELLERDPQEIADTTARNAREMLGGEDRQTDHG